MTKQRAQSWGLLLGLGLMLATAALYWPAASFGFLNFDDPKLVTANPGIRSVDLIGKLTAFSSEYIPLTFISYALEYRWFGLSPDVYHLNNVLLHLLNVGLVLALTLRFRRGLGLGLASAAMFALHPIAVEPVAWISGRKDLLVAAASLACMLTYYGYSSSDTSKSSARRRVCYVASLWCFALALLAKATAICLPVALLAMDQWLVKRPLRFNLLSKLPFALAAIPVLLIHLRTHRSLVAIGGQEYSLVAATWSGVEALVFYVSKVFLPVGLSAYYEAGAVNVSMIDYAIAGGFVAVAAWSLRRRGAGLAAFGLVFFFTMILPALKVVPFGNNFIYADRYLYLPRLGIFWWLAVTVGELPQVPVQRARAIAAMLLLAVALSSLTSRRLRVWGDNEALYESMLEHYPGTSNAYYGLAQLRKAAGDTLGEIALYWQTLSLNPKHFEANVNLANHHLRNGDLAVARELYLAARAANPRIGAPHFGLGMIELKSGRLEDAERSFRAAFDVERGHAPAAYHLGRILLERDAAADALVFFKKVIALTPDRPEPYLHAAEALTRIGELEEAAAMRRAARALGAAHP